MGHGLMLIALRSWRRHPELNFTACLLLQSVSHKMDFFDPEVLNRMVRTVSDPGQQQQGLLRK